MSRWPTERLLLTPGGLRDAQGRAWPDLAAWCAEHPRRRLALLVGAERLHSLHLAADLPLTSDEARRRYARLQFEHYFGPAAQHWPLATHPDAACALTEDDPAELLSTAAAHRVQLVSLRPSWTLLPADDGRHRLQDDRLVTQLRRQGGRLVELQAQHAEEGAADCEFSHDLLGTPTLAPGPDFIPPASWLRPFAWAWAGTAAAACALLAVQGLSQRDEARALAEQSQVLDRLAQVAAPPAAASAPSRPSAAARSRAWQAAQQLQTDWAARWGDIDRALPPGLSLASMELDGPSLRLEGLSATADGVTQLVDRLTLQAAPGEEVVLTRLQQPAVPGDSAGLRFELVRRPAGGLR